MSFMYQLLIHIVSINMLMRIIRMNAVCGSDSDKYYEMVLKAEHDNIRSRFRLILLVVGVGFEG